MFLRSVIIIALLIVLTITSTVLIFVFPERGEWKPKIERIVDYHPKETQVVSFSRHACFGPCPVFDFYVFPDDSFVFIGHRYVKKKGAYRGKLFDGAFVSLINLLDNNDFLKLARIGRLTNDRKGDVFKCGLYSTDGPVITVATQLQGSMLSFTYDTGCTLFAEESTVKHIIDEFERVASMNVDKLF
ncbi:DUF6438 domain-containing protein [Psychrobium sp. MM17-31]|uniref:DUF6438 domain-containing protein n=1 Tax=Psychrobium sp. MM17-31 TaxID=2917758 RepID=UPI001EF6C264|nr:DUF6438 domain-containing protein [Psychrobium sp. MM17-31]MCG7530407.1 DUF6438 domain-containing protein [Psychrobium sp. MM17-31]